MRVMNHQIIINPRCKTLIYHLKYATWARKSDKATSAGGYKAFARSADGGHFDSLDSLIYLIRNIIYGKNPYPKGYGALSGADNHFREESKQTHQIVADMLRLRKPTKK